jgi:hypothetical protein
MAWGDDERGQFIDDYRDLTSPISMSGKGNSNDEPGGSQYTFCRGVVSEFISNPASFLNRAVKDVESGDEIGIISDFLIFDSEIKEQNPIVSNYKIARYMPVNSIMCYVPKGGGGASDGDLPIIAYPFFPQHLSLPLKPGEATWLLKEESGGATLYYWLCRVTCDRQADDLNYTSLDRNFFIRNAFDKFIREGAMTDEKDTNLVSARGFLTSPNAPVPNSVTYDSICAKSVSFLEEFTGEPVPRKFKDCGDLLLQGSNNASIHLTTEKFKTFEDADKLTFSNQNAPQQLANMRKPLAGTVDIAVGREKERLLTLSATSTPETASAEGLLNVSLGHRKQGMQSLENYEIDKLDEVKGRSENQQEGLDDPRNVFARMYASMNASPDKSFEFANADFESLEGPTVVNYGDLVRTYAEENFRVYNYAGNSVIDMASDGSITLQTGDGDAAAKIILKASGDIVIKPGTGGLLHLGGDESDSTVAVCGTTAAITGGTAVGTPSVDAFGGTAFAEPAVPGGGFTSTKVVMKVS